MKNTIIGLLAIIVVTCVMSVYADTIMFKSGKQIEGTIKNISDVNITVNLYDVTEMTYDLKEIDKINGEPVKQAAVVKPETIGIMVPEASGTFRSSEEAIRKFKQAGLPTSIDELIPSDIPDSENGAIIYKEAFELLNVLKNKYKNEWEYLSYPREYDNAPAEEKKKYSSIMLSDPDFGKLSELINSASKMKCQFIKRSDLKPGIEMLAYDTEHLGSLRECARILCVKSKIEAQAGMGDQCLQDAIILLNMPRSLEEEPFFISQLVRMALDVIAVNNMNEIINNVALDKNFLDSIVSSILSETNDKKVMTGLKGDAVSFITIYDQFRKAAKESDAKDFEMLDKMGGEKPDKEFLDSYKKNPQAFWDNQKTIYLMTLYDALTLSAEPYYKVSDKIKRLEDGVIKLPQKDAYFLKLSFPALLKGCTQEARVNAYLGATEIGLANRLYRSKYGKYADSLDQLAPEFLQKVPSDPFTGKSYIYTKRSKGFAVYSVDEDLKDNGGESQGFGGDKRDITWIDKGN